jgi:hypothetical protein
MNPCNILREFKDVINKTFVSINDPDIENIKNELFETYNRDLILKNHFDKETSKLLKHIDVWYTKLKTNQKIKNRNDLPNHRLLNHFIDDYFENVLSHYKAKNLEEIESYIGRGKNIKALYGLIDSLLSTLLDEGYSLDSLFLMCRNILIDNKTEPQPNFDQNFEFLKQTITGPPSNYKIIFKIEGFKNADYLPDSISGFEFSNNVVINNSGDVPAGFLRANTNTLFASTQVEAHDGHAAGYKARYLLDEILDLFRYELQEGSLYISSRFVSIKNDRARMFKLIENVPNPKPDITENQFQDFIRNVVNYLHLDGNPKHVKEKVRSTLRFYRMGRDSDQIENKFMNWWTALEHLVRTGTPGSIFSHTQDQLVPVLTINYIPKMLRSYRDSLSFCEVLPRQETIAAYNISAYKDLSLVDFYKVISQPDEYLHIVGNLKSYPVLLFSFARFKKSLSTPDMIKRLLLQHERKVKWHLNRIYRARCDLVHSAVSIISINMLCANLELYLKTCFSTILRFISESSKSLTFLEIYDFLHHCRHEIQVALDEGSTDNFLESFDLSAIN